MLENKNKLFLSILLLGLVLVIGGVYTMNQKTIDESEIGEKDKKSSTVLEWVSYEEERYGFSFSYPKGSFIDREENESGKILNLGGAEPLKPLEANEPYTADFFVWYKNDGNEDVPISCPLDWFENYTVSTNKDDIEIYSGTKKFAEGQEGDPAFGGQQIYCLERSEYTLFISGEDRSDKNILNQIIDSIKF